MGYTGRLKDTGKRDNKGKKCVVEPNTFADVSTKTNESSIVLTPLTTETLGHRMESILQLTGRSQLHQGAPSAAESLVVDSKITGEIIIQSLRRQAAAPPVYLLAITVAPFCLAIFIATSRWSGFRYRGFDILVGFYIGVFTVILDFSFCPLPITVGASYIGEKAVERGMDAQVLDSWVHRAKCDRYDKNEGLGTAYPPFETEIGISPVIKGAFLSDDDLTSTTAKFTILETLKSLGTQMLGISSQRRWDAAHLRTNSTKSLDDSDSFATNKSTPPTSPDIKTGERTPSPKPNHRSGYFKNSTKPAALVEPEPAPMIPQRSPTHTKKNSVDVVVRSRSISRISGDSDLSTAFRSLQAFSRTPPISAFEAFVFFWAESR
ncbi:hypothetical protein H0G86_000321 [Trichoderma simmonsii]|uniref:Uncharacterized protein n=1 Tax=Trichoderma simmonsii TaxID=1491479 RepID=A0A8G0PDU4_9HYPO|nr:hypothetical protein H0G86_000321 [Trichoderma simmonsii]